MFGITKAYNFTVSLYKQFMMVFCATTAQPSDIAIKQKGLKGRFNIIN